MVIKWGRGEMSIRSSDEKRKQAEEKLREADAARVKRPVRQKGNAMKPIIYIETLPQVSGAPRYFASCPKVVVGDVELSFSSDRNGCTTREEAIANTIEGYPPAFEGGYETVNGAPPREEPNA